MAESGIVDDGMIFYDEFGFNLHLHRAYGWSRRGKPAWAELPTERGSSISVGAAISSAGVVCARVKFGPFNSAELLPCVMEGLLPALEGRGPKHAMMSNAPLHRRRSVSAAFGNSIQLSSIFPPIPRS